MYIMCIMHNLCAFYLIVNDSMTLSLIIIVVISLRTYHYLYITNIIVMIILINASKWHLESQGLLAFYCRGCPLQTRLGMPSVLGFLPVVDSDYCPLDLACMHHN